jgi:hypothetical protein
VGDAALGLPDGLAAGDGVEVPAGAQGLGPAVSEIGVGTVVRCRLRPTGTTTIPSAVAIRKATAPHSRRRKSLLTLR